jgi:hypothetical protein
MSKTELDLLHYINKVKQLEWLLEQERIKNFGLKRLIVETKFQLQPLLAKLDRVRKGDL